MFVNIICPMALRGSLNYCKVRLRGLCNRQRSVLLWVARDFQSQGTEHISFIVSFGLDTP
jgi:hypothetical protein